MFLARLAELPFIKQTQSSSSRDRGTRAYRHISPSNDILSTEDKLPREICCCRARGKSCCKERYFVQEDLLSHEYSPSSPAISRKEFFAGYVATDAVPLLSRRNSQEPTCCHGRQLQSQRQTPFSRSRTFTAQGPCLHVWSGGS